MNELTIGQLAEKLNLKPSAIRCYEQVGLLPPPKREEVIHFILEANNVF
ncbi:MerR family transcriptional regulator [Bacillus gobiensis]